MEYMTVQQAADKWGVSVRRVQYLCNKGLLHGAAKLGRFWIMPKDAAKPSDSRYKCNKEKQTDMVQACRSFADKEAIFAKIIEFFPYPLHVYAPDGTLVLTNQACLNVMHIPSKDKIVGVFNVLKDPIIDLWGEDTRSKILKSFQGESVYFYDLVMPIQNILRKFGSDEVCSEISFQNITCFPIYNDEQQLAYVVHVFITARLYNNEAKTLMARKYIEDNWVEEFDLNKIAQAVNLSKHHFARQFKKDTTVTPFKYYQDIKINKLKDKLCDTSLSVSEAFSACGVDYSGNYARVFKEKVGMTPTEYRKLIGQK